MATDIRFIGEAPLVAQVDKFTPGGTIEIGDIFTLTIVDFDGSGSHAVSFTATATTVANVTAGLEAAWNADTNVLAETLTASDQTTYMDLTADTAGVAFNVVGTTTEAGGGPADDQTFVRAVVTANGGPKDVSDGNNWDGGIAPGGAANQNAYIENWDGDLIYGLDLSGAANVLDSLNIGQSTTGLIGVNGAPGHSGTYLRIKTAKLDIGYHYASGKPIGSSRIMIDLVSTACAVTIHNSGTTTDTDKPAIRLLANSSSTDIEVRKGKVGIAFEAGETSVIGDINASFVDNISADVELFVGIGVTVAIIVKTGGQCTLGCGAIEVTNDGGNIIAHGTGAVATYNVNAGNVQCNSTGTITNLNIKGNGVADFSKSSAARTVTTPKIDPSGKIIYDPSIVTMTSKIQPISASGKITFSAA